MIRTLFLSLFFVTGLHGTASAAIASPPAQFSITVVGKSGPAVTSGRKLTFRERLAVRALARRKHKQARKARRPGDGYGNGLAIAGFVCGVVSLLGGGFLLGVPAIVLSAIGLRKANREGRPHRGLAIAGLVCGIVSVAATIILIGVLLSVGFL